MTDYSEYLIKLRALTKQAEDQLNQGDYKAAFATSIQMVNTSIKLQQWTWEKLPK
jgi:HEPN domain-containing protein